MKLNRVALIQKGQCTTACGYCFIFVEYCSKKRKNNHELQHQKKGRKALKLVNLSRIDSYVKTPRTAVGLHF